MLGLQLSRRSLVSRRLQLADHQGPAAAIAALADRLTARRDCCRSAATRRPPSRRRRSPKLAARADRRRLEANADAAGPGQPPRRPSLLSPRNTVFCTTFSDSDRPAAALALSRLEFSVNLRGHADRPRHPRPRADRAPGPRHRPGPDGADRRDRRRQVHHSRRPGPGARRAARTQAWCGAAPTRPTATAIFALRRRSIPAWACARGEGAGRRAATRIWSCAAPSERDGRSRAFVNDQPAAVGVLRELGALLLEVHGQHETVGLLDAAHPPAAAGRLRRP